MRRLLQISPSLFRKLLFGGAMIVISTSAAGQLATQAADQERAYNLSCRALDAEIAKDHARAYQLASEALTLIDTTKPSMLAADLHQRIGYNLFWLKDKERTLPHLEKSNEIIAHLCPECSEMRAKNLTYAGQFHYFVKRDVRKALKSLKDAVETWMLRPVIDTVNFAMTLSTLGDTYRQLGEYESAEAVLTQAYLIRSQVLGPHSKEALTSRFKLGAVFLEARQYLRAKELYESALAETKGNPMDPGTLLHLKNNLAVALTELGDWARAEKLYLEIMHIHSAPATFDAEQLLATLQNLALLQTKMGRMADAERHFTQAQKLTEKHFFSNFDLALLQRDLAYFHLQNGDLAAALLHNQAGIHLFDSTVNPQDPLSLPRAERAKSALELLQPLKTKGELLMMSYEQGHGGQEYLIAALRSLDLAISLIDEIWAVSEAPEDKLHQNEYGVSIYEQALDVCIRLWQLSGKNEFLKRAFHYLEKGKAQLMLESIQETKAASTEGVPEALLSENRELRQAINNLKIRIEAANEIRDSATVLHTQLLQLRYRQDRLRDSIRRGYPSFAHLATQRTILNFNQLILHYTSPAELFVEYLLSDSSLTVFSVHEGRPSLRRQAIDLKMHEMLSSFGRETRETASAQSEPATFQRRANALFHLLLGPEIRAANGKIQQIRIIPDGILSTIPFEALIVAPLPDPVGFEDLDYAIRHFNIRYAPSASLLHAIPAASTARYPNSCLGMAWSNNDNSVFRSVKTQEWPDLPGTAKELLAISEKVDGEYFWGKNASESVFKAHAGQFGIIHLALHGSAKDNRPVLIFPESGPDEDGILHMEELYSMQLAAKLTVLSACETGLGEVQQGEGVMSMARGFGVAGCPTVVMSLWEIEDRASSLIMDQFYSGLAKTKGVDVALREAKLNYMNTEAENAAPAYWASFIPLGKTDPMLSGSVTGASKTIRIVGVIALLMAAGFMFAFRERRQTRY